MFHVADSKSDCIFCRTAGLNAGDIFNLLVEFRRRTPHSLRKKNATSSCAALT